MRIFFAIALIIALLVTVFAVQNNQPITISFLFWSIEGSLALVLMITLVLGIAIGVLLMAPGSVRSRLRVGSLQRAARSMEVQSDAEEATSSSQTMDDTAQQRSGEELDA